ncbi:helix-turn-helix domain-containing protein [Salininema proteolyticum]
MFDAGATPLEVSQTFEVSTKTGHQWHRAWKEGGDAALKSKGASGAKARLNADQLAQLEKALEAGPQAAGLGDDQRWTLARVRSLIQRRFATTYSLKGVSLVLHSMGWSPQIPDAKASDRDDEAIVQWQKKTWPQVKGSRAGWARG